MLSKDIGFLKSVYIKNSYPSDLFFACVNKFLNCKCGTVSDTKTIEDKVEPIFFVPYFVGLPSVIYGRKIRDLLIRNSDVKLFTLLSKLRITFF